MARLDFFFCQDAVDIVVLEALVHDNLFDISRLIGLHLHPRFIASHEDVMGVVAVVNELVVGHVR